MSLAFPLYSYYSIFSPKTQEPSYKTAKSPGVTSTERIYIDFLLPEYWKDIIRLSICIISFPVRPDKGRIFFN